MFDARVADPGIGGRDAGQFVKNGLAVLVGHGITHARGDLAGDLPVILGRPRRIDRFSDPLHPPLRIGEGAVLLGKALGGQHHVGHLGGLGEKDILNHQKIEVAQALFGMVQVGIGHQRVLADDVQGLESLHCGLWEPFP